MSGRKQRITSIDTLIYLLLKKLFDTRAGPNKGITKTKAVKDDYKRGSTLIKSAVSDVIAESDEEDLKQMKDLINNKRQELLEQENKTPTNNTLINAVYQDLTALGDGPYGLGIIYNSTVGEQIFTNDFRDRVFGDVQQRQSERAYQESRQKQKEDAERVRIQAMEAKERRRLQREAANKSYEEYREKMRKRKERREEELKLKQEEFMELKQEEKTPENDAEAAEVLSDIESLKRSIAELTRLIQGSAEEQQRIEQRAIGREEKTEQRAVEREEKAKEQRTEIKTGVQELTDRFEEIKRYNEILRDAKLDVKRVGDNKVRLDQKIGLDNKQINRLIENMPREYRSTLGAPIRSLFSKQEELNYNTLISGLVGFASVVATGNPAIGPLVTEGVNMINSFFNINFNDLLGLRTAQPLESKEEVITPVNVPTAAVSATSEPRRRALPTREEDPRTLIDSRRPGYDDPEMFSLDIDTKAPVQVLLPPVDMPTPKRKGLKMGKIREAKRISKKSLPQRALDLLPSLTPEALEARREAIRISPLEGREAALSAATSAALTAASSGSAVAAVLSTIPAGLLGVAARSLSRPQVSSLINYYESQQGRNLDEKTKEKVQNTLELLPASMVGGLVGRAAVSGGISEQQIDVDEAIIAETQAKIDQESGRNKQWGPKQIAATPEILGSSNQEMYADDIESSLFDYVTPTSEGANGTIKSNALKRSQFMNEQLRYFNSGVFVPYELFTKFTNEQNLDDLSLGQKPIISLPEMKFERLDQQNTWNNVASKQFVNRENTSVGLLDPYRFFSNVTNDPYTVNDSVLYTINP